jgi:hypothetical protein
MRNKALLDSELNKTFDEILAMTTDEFRQWCRDIRKLVVKLWDEQDLPPIVGYSEHEIVLAFKEMSGLNLENFAKIDQLTPNEGKTVIRNTSNYSGYVNSWFPTMMKTRINYSKKDDGKSIYDFFSREDLFETFVTYASRHFKRDSFYAYSNPIKANDLRFGDYIPKVGSASSFIFTWFKYNRYKDNDEYGFWLCPVKGKEYSGYDEKLKGEKFLEIHYDLLKEDFEWYMHKEPSIFGNVDPERSKLYQIRVYKKGQKLFPVGLKAWKVSFCQYAVNFPPLTARYLYEKYLAEMGVKNEAIIYDPSMGWAGRLVGALSVRGPHITYIGTDPNHDHDLPNGQTKYTAIRDFYQTHFGSEDIFARTMGTNNADTSFLSVGSEVIAEQPEFQKYKGKVDIVFTSPPYFAKEAYSNDPEQSYKKFPSYDGWRDGFLRPTLATAVEWLKPGGFLLWNIADAKFGNDMLPLEQDSCTILEELGMKKVRTEKMALAQMPGGNRLDENGRPKAKNFCKVSNSKAEDIWLKYEPIFVYRKP